MGEDVWKDILADVLAQAVVSGLIGVEVVTRIAGESVRVRVTITAPSLAPHALVAETQL